MYMTKHNCDFVHQGFGSAMAGMKNAASPNQDQFQSCSLSFKVLKALYLVLLCFRGKVFLEGKMKKCLFLTLGPYSLG